MKTALDIESWARRDHFHFFRQFEEPFFGLTATVDCRAAYNDAKAKGQSFFLRYLHDILCAVNAVEPFHYRIENEQVFVYERVDASPTVNRPDHTFGFSYMEFIPDFEQFQEKGKAEIARVQAASGLELAGFRNNIIHFSALPWVHFTSLSHARSFAFPDSVPKISVGKIITQGDQLLMPVSVHVHHALVDGYHVGQFFEILQARMGF